MTLISTLTTTSYRIDHIEPLLESIFANTVLPDRVILNVSKYQGEDIY